MTYLTEKEARAIIQQAVAYKSLYEEAKFDLKWWRISAFALLLLSIFFAAGWAIASS